MAVDGGAGLAEGLERVAASLRSHREQSVWGGFAQHPWGVEFARCMKRGGVAGVSAVEAVTRLAAELRRKRARAANTRARRAAVSGE
ncbi:hypothetical protein [Streptomyces albus]|uniref:hypothetical protein n=1 Tax=Streptomyces sp. NRRL F-5639 TaxID=1463867 RepID=UPI00069070AA|nr:hypothetical protein [Streptomyces sp. NRRL F-5639]